MRATVEYGKKQIEFDLPPGTECAVVEPATPPAIEDPEEAIRKTILSPDGTNPLARLAEGRESAVIVVPDATRPLHLRSVLPPILETVTAAVPAKRVTILFATGMHRPVTRDEAISLLGPQIESAIHSVSHDPEDVESIGTTGRGTPMLLNRGYLAHDLRIIIGLVEPHLLAGFSGGRKLIAPGIVGLDAMPVLHGPDIIGHPKTRVGILNENPFHREAMEIATAARVDFAVHVVNGKARLPAGLFAGDLDHSYREACRFLTASTRRETGGDLDLVVTSGGGAPLDRTFYQSVKGIVTAESIVKPGGTVLLAASCEEGWGSEPFTGLLGTVPNLPSFLEWSRRPGSFRLDQWMVQHLREAMENLSVSLYSGNLEEKRAESYGILPVRSIEHGIASALDGIENPRMAVLPEGPYTWVVPRR